MRIRNSSDYFESLNIPNCVVLLKAETTLTLFAERPLGIIWATVPIEFSYERCSRKPVLTITTKRCNLDSDERVP